MLRIGMEKMLKQKLNSEDVSPERIQQAMKKYPPFLADTIPEEEIETFSKKGTLGWTYLTQ